jgi:MtN3 and saliva related transmembrane protein
MSIERYIIGYSALACSFLYRIPQIIKIYRSKKGEDISAGMIHVQNASYVLYIVYGYIITDLIYIISSITSIAQNLVILYFKYKFEKGAREAREGAREVRKVIEIVVEH